MNGLNCPAHMLETRLRIERAEQRATLLASLGALPKPGPMRLFARRVVPLAGPVEVRHAVRQSAAATSTRRAA
jgi:hypothetical protein